MNELELEKHKLELHTVFDSLDDIVLMIDRDMIIVDANKALFNAFGSKRSDVIGRPFSNFLSPEVASFRKRVYRQVFADKERLELVSEADGRWYQTKINPIFEEKAETSNLLLVVRDITDERLAAISLQKSESQFRNYFDLGLVGMTISSLDRKWLNLNDRMCEILGYSRGELIGQDWANFTHPDDVANDKTVFGKVSGGLKDNYIREKRYIRKDGEIVHAKVSSRAVLDEYGNVDHMVALVDDVTGRKKAEAELADSYSQLERRVAERTQELQKSEEKLREFALSAVDSYWEMDADLRIIFSSERDGANNKWSQKSILDKTPKEIHEEFAIGGSWRAFYEALEKRESFRDIEMVDVGPDGKQLFLRRSGTPIIDERGKFSGYRGTTTDVTQYVKERERAATIERQFFDAIENMSEGFILWDKDSFLVQCNEYFKSQMPPEIQKVLKPGLWFGDFMRMRAEIGKFENAQGRMDAWVVEVVSEHGQGPHMVFRDKIKKDRWVEIRVNHLENGSILEFYRDVTDLKEIEQSLKRQSDSDELIGKISAVANESSSLSEAFQGCLDIVCDYTGWPLGHIWRISDKADQYFESTGIWHIENREKYAPIYEHSFESVEAVKSSKIFEVFQNGKIFWSNDITNQRNLERVEIMIACGAKGGILSPIKVDGEVFAVMEFFSEEWGENDTEFTNVLSQIELQLSHVIERERVKEELQIGEERFRDFAGSVADRFWETDADFRYRFISEGSGNLTRTSESLIGKAPWEVEGVVHSSADWNILKEGIAEQKAFRDFRYRWKDDNGMSHPLKLSASPFYDNDGTYLGYRGATIDETSIVEARAQAEFIKNQFHDAMENLDSGFILWDADDRFVACNSFYQSIQQESRNILKPGISYVEFIEAMAEGNAPRYDKSEKETWIAERILDHQKPSESHEYQLDDGRWLRIRKQKLENGATISFHSDISDLKQRESELYSAIREAEAANQTKTEFLANMSHELRTPLNAVIGFSDALKHGIVGDLANNNQLEYLDNINAAGHHLLQLINDILDVATIEAGQFDLRIEKVSLSEIVLAAMKLIEPRARENGVTIENQLAESDAFLLVDELRFKQILLNILSNAVKFTPEEGTVWIDFMDNPGDDNVTISIKDSGIGMDEMGLQKAMMIFGQVESSMSREREGTGLGIPLTKSFIESHGGTLEIDSTLGRGTTVLIQLPRTRLIS